MFSSTAQSDAALFLPVSLFSQLLPHLFIIFQEFSNCIPSLTLLFNTMFLLTSLLKYHFSHRVLLAFSFYSGEPFPPFPIAQFLRLFNLPFTLSWLLLSFSLLLPPMLF